MFKFKFGIIILILFCFIKPANAEMISLSRSIAVAKQNNLDHKKQKLFYDIAKLGEKHSRANYLPKVNGSFESPYIDSKHGNKYEFHFIQPLYHFGNLSHQVNASIARKHSQLYNVINNELQLEQQVVEAYVNVLKQEKLYVLNNSAINRAKEQLDFVKKEIKEGERGKEARLRWEVLVNEYQNNAIDYQHQITESRIVFASLLNRNYVKDLELVPYGVENFEIEYMNFKELTSQFSNDKLFDYCYEYALRMNPSVYFYNSNIKAAEYDYKAEQSDRMPRIDFTPQYDCDVADVPEYSVRITASYYFLDANDAVEAEIMKKNKERAELDKEIFLRNLKSNLRSILSKLVSSMNRVVLKGEQSDQAYNYLNHMLDSYRLGKVEDVEMVDAFRSYYSNRSSEIESIYGYYIEKQALDSLVGASDFRQTITLAEFVKIKDKDKVKISKVIDEGGEIFRAVNKQEREKAMKMIEENPALVNASNYTGWTPLHWAAYTGDTEIIKFILNKGADINVVSRIGLTTVYLATSEGHKEATELLLKEGADPNIPTKRTDWTAMMRAANNSFNEILKMLIQYGGKVNVESAASWTPLHRAAEKGNLESVKILLDAGADINARNSEGQTPLDLAETFGNDQVVDYLKKRGGTTNALNEFDN